MNTVAREPVPCDHSGPLFRPNPLKLGLFGANVSSAGALTKARDRHEISWAQNLKLVHEAEAAGFEAAVPFARWRGFEGASNPWGQSFEPYTWASALAAATTRIGLIATSHMMTLSPVMAAKQITTIDHVSNGRAALNVVAGWFEKELKMFGVGQYSHDERYAYGAEWMEALYRLWSESDSFDFLGQYVKVVGGYQQPKNIQSPRPPVMNAAFSPAGHAFAARWADIAFVSPDSSDPGAAAAQVASLRSKAEDHGRTMQVWVAASVVAAETDGQADREIARFGEDEVDAEAVANCLEWTMGGAHLPEERRKTLARNVAAFVGGYPLFGSYQKVADTIAGLSKAGVDGICLTWMNYERGLPAFVANVLPRLERYGLRDAYAHAGSEDAA